MVELYTFPFVDACGIRYRFNKEGIVLGVMAKMFTIAGPIIVTGISSSVLVGIIYWVIGVV